LENTAQKIYKAHFHSWSKKKWLYGVSQDEMKVLLEDKKNVVIKINKDMKNGTFYTEVRYHRCRFGVTTMEKI